VRELYTIEMRARRGGSTVQYPSWYLPVNECPDYTLRVAGGVAGQLIPYPAVTACIHLTLGK
jgi:hypothetical protein